MAKYHISPETGRPNVCKAKIKCPIGVDEPHYDSKEDAREGYEQRMKTETLPTASKKAKNASSETVAADVEILDTSTTVKKLTELPKLARVVWPGEKGEKQTPLSEMSPEDRKSWIKAHDRKAFESQEAYKERLFAESMRQQEINDLKERINRSYDPDKTAREVFAEHRGQLDYDEAMEISQAVYRDALDGVSVETSEIIYGRAYEAVYADSTITKGKERWDIVLDEYSESMTMIRAVRESEWVDVDQKFSPLAKRIKDSVNPAAAAREEFRKNRYRPAKEGREFLEAVHADALSTLDQKAKDAIWWKSHDETAARGWVDDTESYAENIELVNRTKINDPTLRQVAKETGEENDLTVEYARKTLLMTDQQLKDAGELNMGKILFPKTSSDRDMKYVIMNDLVEAEKHRRAREEQEEYSD